MEPHVVAIVTPGGDAPGMNAAIRSITISAHTHNIRVLGVVHGSQGLFAGKFALLTDTRIANINRQPGTVLGSARTRVLEDKKGVNRALLNLRKMEVDSLVVIGGNGSQHLAYVLSQAGFPVVGVAATIDNDLIGSEPTIGADTAINIALTAVDQIKATADAFERVFLIETMGRKCGYLAVMTAIAAGTQGVVIPEYRTTPEQVAQLVRAAYRCGRNHCIIVVAEGAHYNAEKLERHFTTHKERLGFELRTIKLGHIQRGGTPTALDRALAARLGAHAVDALLKAEYGMLVGVINGNETMTPLADVAGKTKSVDKNLFELANKLTR